MEKSRYEYTTTPRKIQPDYIPQKRNNKNKLRIIEERPKKNIKISKEQKNKKTKVTLIVIAIFLLLLTISYRNSKINEKFSQVQGLKKELSSLEKENEQLKVNIENGLNLNNIEKLAKEKLGMQKLTNKQTLYVSLPKKDYVEAATEEVKKEEEKNWFEQIIDNIFGNN